MIQILHYRECFCDVTFLFFLFFSVYFSLLLPFLSSSPPLSLFSSPFSPLLLPFPLPSPPFLSSLSLLPFSPPFSPPLSLLPFLSSPFSPPLSLLPFLSSPFSSPFSSRPLFSSPFSPLSPPFLLFSSPFFPFIFFSFFLSFLLLLSCLFSNSLISDSFMMNKAVRLSPLQQMRTRNSVFPRGFFIAAANYILHATQNFLFVLSTHTHIYSFCTLFPIDVLVPPFPSFRNNTCCECHIINSSLSLSLSLSLSHRVRFSFGNSLFIDDIISSFRLLSSHLDSLTQRHSFQFYLTTIPPSYFCFSLSQIPTSLTLLFSF
ncbi:unnamed protein product [Acanthosepion pharaonis]|uniref:Uncharacterized protein n=1 Tax=Acanthosepion pharaonis TaxID=158019 RepID=A0A812DLL7_ACAPH|nr:unnamed protein product [Sepia pharaonis]